MTIPTKIELLELMTTLYAVRGSAAATRKTAETFCMLNIAADCSAAVDSLSEAIERIEKLIYGPAQSGQTDRVTTTVRTDSPGLSQAGPKLSPAQSGQTDGELVFIASGLSQAGELPFSTPSKPCNKLNSAESS